MIVGKASFESETSYFGIDAVLVEPEYNNEASTYITNNYNQLLKYVRSLGIKEEKAGDLLQDVFVSIAEAEADGRGYDIDYSLKNGNDNFMVVEQFVIGRIKKYAKNSRYSTDVVETGRMSYSVTECVESPALNSNGYMYDKYGNQIMEKHYTTKNTAIPTTVSAASYNQGNDQTDINDSFQKAYAMATTADSIEDIAELYSLREQIDYCISVCSLHDFNIVNLLKNMDMLADMLGDPSKKKKTADSIFTQLSDLVDYHTDLGEALTSILRYSSSNRTNFDSVIATY
jgi:hypothetical protein